MYGNIVLIAGLTSTTITTTTNTTTMHPIIANITTTNMPIHVTSYGHNHFILRYTTHQMEHFVP